MFAPRGEWKETETSGGSFDFDWSKRVAFGIFTGSAFQMFKLRTFDNVLILKKFIEIQICTRSLNDRKLVLYSYHHSKFDVS